MFSKKKYTGNVTILEDDDESDRSKLFENQVRSTYVRDSERTNEELNEAILREAQMGKQETERALRTATEARDTGKEIAISLHSQTQQLEKNSEELANIHEHLDKAEHLVHKIKTPKLLRMFRKKPKSGRGLKSAKVSRSERKGREKLREKGVESLGLLSRDEAEESEHSDSDLEIVTAGNASGEYKRRVLFGRERKAKARVKVGDIHDDYSEYEAPVREVLMEQDKNLELISDVVRETQELAQAMGHEIELQEGLIDQVQAEVHVTKDRTNRIARSVMEE